LKAKLALHKNRNL